MPDPFTALRLRDSHCQESGHHDAVWVEQKAIGHGCQVLDEIANCEDESETIVLWNAADCEGKDKEREAEEQYEGGVRREGVGLN